MHHGRIEERDWKKLAARHDQAPDEDFPGWREALEAMESDPEERRRAIDADPLLLFRRTAPATEVSSDELAAMKQAVAHLRRAKAVEKTAEDRLPTGSWPESRPMRQRILLAVARRSTRSVFRLPARVRPGLAAAVAAVFASALLLDRVDLGPSPAEVRNLIESPPAATAALEPTDSPILEVAEQMPLVEDVGASMDMVMQLDDEGLTLVVFSPNSAAGALAGNDSPSPQRGGAMDALSSDRAAGVAQLGGLEG
ncbi:MAG: hypothetical protein MI919_31325 [Holophagales bacterium]|nr:hypothetical protein [Holophagales bacterium]